MSKSVEDCCRSLLSTAPALWYQRSAGWGVGPDRLSALLTSAPNQGGAFKLALVLIVSSDKGLQVRRRLLNDCGYTAGRSIGTYTALDSLFGIVMNFLRHCAPNQPNTNRKPFL